MILRIGVSLAAIALAAPALAADKVVRAPVPAADRGEFRAFVEGGAFWTAGNAIPYTAPGFEIFGATSILPLANGGNGASLGGNASLRPRVGWDAAVGFDYRFAGTPWHVNMQARGGEARGSAATSASFSQTSLQIEDCCNPPIGIFTSDSRSTRGISNTSAELKESHWQADFGMGYDFVPRLMHSATPSCRRSRAREHCADAGRRLALRRACSGRRPGCRGGHVADARRRSLLLLRRVH